MNDDAQRFLLDLYRASRRMPHSELKPWVFEGLARLVQFDSGFWYRWAVFDTPARLHAWYLFRQPDSLIHEYDGTQLWREDIVYERAMTAPLGTAVRGSFEEYRSERMKNFMRRHRQEHLVSIANVQEVPQIAVGMSFYRNETRKAFSEDEGQALAALMPHVIDAWRENWLMALLRGTGSTPEPIDFSLAMVVQDLTMSEAQENFGELMHREWPRWKGPRLPSTLENHLANPDRSGRPWAGKAITVYDRRQPDGTTLLFVRRGHPFDHIAPRKRETALLFAQGASQSQVADRLRLSPSTVNNYLGEVYAELSLGDKTELSRLVMRLAP